MTTPKRRSTDSCPLSCRIVPSTGPECLWMSSKDNLCGYSRPGGDGLPPNITGVYAILMPLAVFAVLGSPPSRRRRRLRRDPGAGLGAKSRGTPLFRERRHGSRKGCLGGCRSAARIDRSAQRTPCRRVRPDRRRRQREGSAPPCLREWNRPEHLSPRDQKPTSLLGTVCVRDLETRPLVSGLRELQKIVRFA